MFELFGVGCLVAVTALGRALNKRFGGDAPSQEWAHMVGPTGNVVVTRVG